MEKILSKWSLISKEFKSQLYEFTNIYFTPTKQFFIIIKKTCDFLRKDLHKKLS